MLSSELEVIYGEFPPFVYRIKSRRTGLKPLFGVGINDVPFVVQPTVGNKQLKHPAYSCWVDMLRRSISEEFKKDNKTYLDVSVCAEWHSLNKFSLWFKENYIHGYHLDKDLLIAGNRVYSPTTCVFVPQKVNSFITLSNKSRGLLPLGVDLYKNKFRSQIQINGCKNTLGLFSDSMEAHKAWQLAKLEQAIAFNFPPLQRIIDQLTFEIENNLETMSL